STGLRPNQLEQQCPYHWKCVHACQQGYSEVSKSSTGRFSGCLHLLSETRRSRASFSLSQTRNSVAPRSRPVICRAGLLFAQNGSMTENQPYSQIPAKTRSAALPICQSKTRGGFRGGPNRDPPRDRAKDGRVSGEIPRHSRPGNPERDF